MVLMSEVKLKVKNLIFCLRFYNKSVQRSELSAGRNC